MKKLFLIVLVLISLTTLGQNESTNLDSVPVEELLKSTENYIPGSPGEGLYNSNIYSSENHNLLVKYYDYNKSRFEKHSYLWLREKYKNHCDSIIRRNMIYNGTLDELVNLNTQEDFWNWVEEKYLK